MTRQSVAEYQVQDSTRKLVIASRWTTRHHSDDEFGSTELVQQVIRRIRDVVRLLRLIMFQC